MCNCNQRRNNLSIQLNANQKGFVKVKLIQKMPLVFNGNITGKMYVFKNLGEVLWIDKKDAVSLNNLNGLQIIYSP